MDGSFILNKACLFSLRARPERHSQKCYAHCTQFSNVILLSRERALQTTGTVFRPKFLSLFH